MKKCLKAVKAQAEVFRDSIEKMRVEGERLEAFLDVIVERIDKGDFNEPD